MSAIQFGMAWFIFLEICGAFFLECAARAPLLEQHDYIPGDAFKSHPGPV